MDRASALRTDLRWRKLVDIPLETAFMRYMRAEPRFESNRMLPVRHGCSSGSRPSKYDAGIPDGAGGLLQGCASRPKSLQAR